MYNSDKLEKIIDNKTLGLPLDFDESELYNELTDSHHHVFYESGLHELMDYMRNPENFYYTCKWIFNIELLPFQCLILKELWQRKFPMLIACRGGSKTFLLSLYALLRAMFDQGSKIIVVGAAFRQSKIMFEFMENVWRRAPIFRSIVGAGKKAGPHKDIDRCNFWVGDSEIMAIPVGCLAGDTLITTDSGIKEIRDVCRLQRDKQILSANTFNDIGDYFDNGRKPVKRVLTEYGYMYEGTYNHMMKVVQDGNIVWRRTDKISRGDKILIDKRIKWFPNPIKCSIDFGISCGKQFGGYDKNVFRNIMSADKTCVAHCLHEIFMQYGSINSRTVVIPFNNLRSCKCAQYILLHFGIISRFVHYYSDGQCCKLIIDKDYERFYKNIVKLDIDEESSKPDYFVDNVVSVEDGYFRNTYDVNVPANNEYIANGFVSHNSGEKIRGLRANYTIVDEFSCVSADTIIPTKCGFHKIGDLVNTPSDVLVVNENGEFEQPGVFIKTPKTDVYRITTQYGYSIDCSEIHRLKVGGKWVLAKDIKVGEVVDIANTNFNKTDNHRLYLKNFADEFCRNCDCFWSSGPFGDYFVLSTIIYDRQLAKDVHDILYYFGCIGRLSYNSIVHGWVLEYINEHALRVIKLFELSKYYDLATQKEYSYDENADAWAATVKSVKKLPEQQILYDFYLPITHTFCGGIFNNHNSLNVDIFEVVIKGFASVAASPHEKSRNVAKIKVLESLGMNDAVSQIKESIGFGNQTILSGTASYSFNHFYNYWQRYKAIIKSQGDKNKLREIFGGDIPENFDWRNYSIIRIPHDVLPEGFMDLHQISSAKAIMHKSLYNMEFQACFSDDSGGFFPRSLIEQCVCNNPIETQEGPVKFTASIRGDSSYEYIYGVDPASEHDNFAIVILELHKDHRRIVYCWTIRRQELRNRMSDDGEKPTKVSFYSYCASKIRSLMKVFPAKYIGIDSQGGGIGVIEALHDVSLIGAGEQPLWPYVRRRDDDPFWWEKKNKPTDNEVGEHILCAVNFVNSVFLSEANHGLKRDFEQKVCLFPCFDAITIAESISMDKIQGRLYDTLEDCVMEIEEMKDELASVIHTRTPTGKDHWDTPKVRTPGFKSGRMRKDRYTALLIANMIARCYQAGPIGRHEYYPVGGFAGQRRSGGSGRMYVGPNSIVEKMNSSAAYKSVRKNRR